MRTESLAPAATGHAPPLAALHLALVTLAVAVSSVVLIEPAPVDLLLMMIMPVSLALGLKVPRALAIPGLMTLAYLFGNLVSIGFSEDPASSTGFTLVTAYLLASSFFLPA